MSNIIAISNKPSATDDDDMFADLPPIDPFEIKKQRIASHITALIVSSGKSRTQIADEIGIHKSVMSRVLSGKNNSKIGTIWQIASHLGYDFDVVFHSDTEQVPAQPWNINKNYGDRKIPTKSGMPFFEIHKDDLAKAISMNNTPDYLIVGTEGRNSGIKTINPPNSENTIVRQLSTETSAETFLKKSVNVCEFAN